MPRRPLWSERRDADRGGLAETGLESARVKHELTGAQTVGLDAEPRDPAALVRDSPDLVGVLSADGDVVYLSPAFARLFTGDDPDAIAAGRRLDLIHPDDVGELGERFAAALDRPGVPVRVRVRSKHRDGEWRMIDGTLTNALADPDIRGVVLRATDVTDQVGIESALRASERHHRRIVESLNEGIILVDASGAVVACNTAAQTILGIEEHSLSGHSVGAARWTIVRADGSPCPPAEVPVNRTLATGEPCHGEVVGVVTPSGTRRWVSVNTRIVDLDAEGRPVLAVSSFTDVSDNVHTNSELEQRLAIEHTLVGLSRDFLDHGHDVLACTEDAIARLGSLTGALRMFAVLVDDGEIDPQRTRIWCADPNDAASADPGGGRTALRVSPDRENRVVRIDSVATAPMLPEADRARLEAMRVGSMMVVPMLRDDALMGFIGIHFADEGACSDPVATGLEHLAAIITTAHMRLEAETARARSDARLEGLLAGSYDVIIVIDEATNLIYATPRIEQLLGKPAAEFVGTTMIELVHPDDLGAAADALNNNLNRVSEGSPAELRVRHADGRWIDVELVGTNRLDDPSVHGIVINVRDISERKAFEATLRDAQDRFEEVFEHAPNGMALSDADGRLFRVNPTMCAMLRVTEGELLGRTFHDITHPSDRARNFELYRELFAGRRSGYVIEKRYLRSDGDFVWCRVHLSVVRDTSGAPQYAIAQIHDITEQRTAAEILEYEARYDALTGLATRKLFLEQLERAIANTRRHGGMVAALFIDLDHFKTVNDTMGHAAGDELLAAVARRMQSVLRVGDFACRFGGDEFMVLCTGLESAADVADVAERLRDAVEHPFQIRGSDVFIGASIGIALADETADASTLLSQADSAAYRAKERGRNRYEVFDDELRAAILDRLETETALRRAIDHDELRLLYQPVVNTSTGAVDGFEALLRWDRPGHGLVSPAAFLEVAEERGLIVPMGRQILEAACAQLVAWTGCGPGGTTPTVAVNLSARQLAHPEFVEQVAEVIDRSGADPRNLCFELTETAVMDDTAAAISTLHRLRAMGVDLAIDDFGTGYSSLSYLRRLPASIVKIDRSFVMELGGSSQGSTIVASVIHLAHALGMRIVAEGVETIEHVAALVTLGCDQMQGFYFARPLPPDEAVEFMRNKASHDQSNQ